MERRKKQLTRKRDVGGWWKQARKLEGEVDAKLAAFARFASAESGANHAASVQVAQTKATEIEQLLKRLREVNGDMDQGVRPGDASHTLARHRDILQDLEREFERARARIETVGSNAGTSSRDALLAGATALSGGNYANRDNALLRERSAIHGTLASTDDVVHQAQSVSITMGEQRRVFDGIGGKTETLQGRFPILHGLMTSIQRKRSKDTLVLAGVIAACVVFLILYRISK